MTDDLTPEALARLWHTHSSVLAWRHNVPMYAVAWDDLPEACQRHMVETAREVLAVLRAGLTSGDKQTTTQACPPVSTITKVEP